MDAPGDPLTAIFHEAVARWFARCIGEPSEPQAQAWPAIAKGGHVLVAAPTGSGKTLAAFLAALDALVRESLANGRLPDETRVVYVSPLKALSNDIDKNLAAPLAGIAEELALLGAGQLPIRTMLRTGDTPQKERAAFGRRPPHVLVTTPESLYIVLTSESGRRALKSVRTVIVDEVHALLGSKRGAHLALSLERLAALTEKPLQRIGLSATQQPIERVAEWLVGTGDGTSGGPPGCTIVDCGHRRPMRLEVELPRSPLEAVMAGEVWEELYDRLAELVRAHRTTLVFVSTRRMAERVSRHLQERLLGPGAEAVLAHHGSLAREHRLRAEQRLKAGELSALVATASLELGIDIGAVDLVCQMGSPRAIATLLQRVGRSGHFKGGVPHGIVFPLSQGELVEAAALLDAIARGELDQVRIPEGSRDVLAQQLAAEVAAEGELDEDTAYARVRRALPYAALPRDRFDAVVRMLAEGFVTARGRRGALLHRDGVHRVLRPRKGTRLLALTCGGAIPDTADYAVVQDPQGIPVGSVNEDFAIESMAGDIFQLGNTSWRILRVEQGTVRVQDAQGSPPTIPFWLGEAPSRSAELSFAVSRLRERVQDALAEGRAAALHDELCALGLDAAGASQLVDYLAAARAALGELPTQRRLIVERFFDEAGGMQLVLHAPFGSRHNRALGLSLRKRFCRAFNFELQAAANEDAIVLSLGPTHSFPLDDLRGFLRESSVRELLVQALLAAPMFETRFRWNATVSLAVRRFGNGKKSPPFLVRMQTNDLLAVAFPDQQACLENVVGDREVPDHPLVQQAVDDCLHEYMDVEALEGLLGRLERGEVTLLGRDLTQPSPLAQEILNARPYAFLDDAPLEERRTQAVMSRRGLDRESARTLGALDQAAIDAVRAEAWPSFDTIEEAHDALCIALAVPESALDVVRELPHVQALATSGRAYRFVVTAPGGGPLALWVAAEHAALARVAWAQASTEPALALPSALAETTLDREQAIRELVRGRLDVLGPQTGGGVAAALGLVCADAEAALLALEAEGSVLRGAFSPGVGGEEFCERRLLSRIHRYTLDRLRSEIEPVSLQVLMRFLLRFQRVEGEERVAGPEGLAAVLEQLEGHSAPAQAWEADLLPARCRDYDPAWLDQLSFSGRFVWARLSAAALQTRGSSLKATPIAFVRRERLGALWNGEAVAAAPASSDAERVRDTLRARGPSFHHELQRQTGLLGSQLDAALGELMARGEVSSDGFAGLRALLRPRRPSGSVPRRLRAAASSLQHAGRIWLVGSACEPVDAEAAIEQHARALLARYGVVFRRLCDRDGGPPWRELVRVLRRLEARGEVRGGRFVQGLTGEQFALPHAVAALRKARTAAAPEQLVSLHAADPLNLLGTVLPGPRIPAAGKNRVVLRDGVPVAVLEAGEVRWLLPLDETTQWNVSLALRRPAASTPNAM